MAKSPREKGIRWLLPLGLFALIVGMITFAGRAGAAPALPQRTAADLLASLQSAGQHPFFGTVAQTSRLGLPQLPDSGSASTSPLALLTGTHQARVWYDSPTKFRVALVGKLAESDVIRNSNEVWIWDSAQRTARHVVLPAEAGTEPKSETPALTPLQAAQQLLAAVDPTTRVTVDGTASVAGRDAYELVVVPKASGSLVGQIRIAIDAKTSDPLRVKVFARNGSKPAFEVTYTSLTYSAPPASVFNFSPPPGATLTQGAMAPRLGDGQRKLESPAEQTGPAQTPDGSYFVGTGWTTVRVMTSVNLSAIGGNADARTLLDAAQPVKGAFGSGRLLRTALVSVLSLDDGRILVGAVTPAVLEQAATQPAPTR